MLTMNVPPPPPIPCRTTKVAIVETLIGVTPYDRAYLMYRKAGVPVEEAKEKAKELLEFLKELETDE